MAGGRTGDRTTAALIDRLSADARPVRPLAAPAARALLWLVAAALLIAVATAIDGLRPDLAARLRDPAFLCGRGAAVLTALTAALAAFELSVPDRSARWLWLPVPFAAVWLSSMGAGCLGDWFARGDAALRTGLGTDCFVEILATSVPLGALLLVMVRHAGPVRPIATALMAGLALAAVGEAGLTLHHPAEAALLDLLMHMAAVAVVVALALGVARPLFQALVPRLPASLR